MLIEKLWDKLENKEIIEIAKLDNYPNILYSETCDYSSVNPADSVWKL